MGLERQPGDPGRPIGQAFDVQGSHALHYSIAWSPDDKRVALMEFNAVTIWDVKSREFVAKLKPEGSSVALISALDEFFAQGGRPHSTGVPRPGLEGRLSAAVSTLAGPLELWDLYSHSLVRTIHRFADESVGSLSLAFAADGAVEVAASTTSGVGRSLKTRSFPNPEFEPMRSRSVAIRNHPDPIGAAWSPATLSTGSENELAIHGSDGVIRFWAKDGFPRALCPFLSPNGSYQGLCGPPAETCWPPASARETGSPARPVGAANAFDRDDPPVPGRVVA